MYKNECMYFPVLPKTDHFGLYPIRILGDLMHTQTVYCGKNIFNRGENQFENESEKYYYFYIKNSVLDLNLFCSRSVLVLNIKTFS